MDPSIAYNVLSKEDNDMMFGDESVKRFIRKLSSSMIQTEMTMNDRINTYHDLFSHFDQLD